MTKFARLEKTHTATLIKPKNDTGKVTFSVKDNNVYPNASLSKEQSSVHVVASESLPTLGSSNHQEMHLSSGISIVVFGVVILLIAQIKKIGIENNG